MNNVFLLHMDYNLSPFRLLFGLCLPKETETLEPTLSFAEQTLTPDARSADTGTIFADHQKRNFKEESGIVWWMFYKNRSFNCENVLDLLIVQYTVFFELTVPASLLLAMHAKGREWTFANTALPWKEARE